MILLFVLAFFVLHGSSSSDVISAFVNSGYFDLVQDVPRDAGVVGVSIGECVDQFRGHQPVAIRIEVNVLV